jgi:hypothetical protein
MRLFDSSLINRIYSLILVKSKKLYGAGLASLWLFYQPHKLSSITYISLKTVLNTNVLRIKSGKSITIQILDGLRRMWLYRPINFNFSSMQNMFFMFQLEKSIEISSTSLDYLTIHTFNILEYYQIYQNHNLLRAINSYCELKKR